MIRKNQNKAVTRKGWQKMDFVSAAMERELDIGHDEFETIEFCIEG